MASVLHALSDSYISKAGLWLEGCCCIHSKTSANREKQTGITYNMWTKDHFLFFYCDTIAEFCLLHPVCIWFTYSTAVILTMGIKPNTKKEKKFLRASFLQDVLYFYTWALSHFARYWIFQVLLRLIVLAGSPGSVRSTFFCCNPVEMFNRATTCGKLWIQAFVSKNTFTCNQRGWLRAICAFLLIQTETKSVFCVYKNESRKQRFKTAILPT